MSDLRNKVIKLAYEKKELREDLLPLLKEAGYAGWDPPENPYGELEHLEYEIEDLLKGLDADAKKRSWDDGESGRDGHAPFPYWRGKMSSEDVGKLLRKLLKDRSGFRFKKEMKLLAQKLIAGQAPNVDLIEEEYSTKWGSYGYLYIHKKGRDWDVRIDVHS